MTSLRDHSLVSMWLERLGSWLIKYKNNSDLNRKEAIYYTVNNN